MTRSDILDGIEELPLPTDTPVNRKRRAARERKLPIPNGAARSPNFNQLPRRTSGYAEAKDGRVVRQPPVLPAFQKPLKPIGLRRVP